ncbi:uncharacterized protein LOC134279068, partial [Saccostrea cucullata]|uniref:uncharacterized protein LOC134279068 n=1 Tax=Saccostrea cuccullata TaxID=36930 RepID=UPI002ED2B744
LQRCCAGFRWSEKEMQCIKRPLGYQGIDCSSYCRYPNYGDGCQQLCVCDEMFCNAETGCNFPTSDVFNGTQNNPGNEMKNVFFSACLAVALCALVIVLLHVGFKISKRVKLRVIERGATKTEKETEIHHNLEEVNQIHVDYLSLRELSARIANHSIADSFTTDGSDFSYIDVNNKKDKVYQNYFSGYPCQRENTNHNRSVSSRGDGLPLSPGTSLQKSNSQFSKTEAKTLKVLYENEMEDPYFLLLPLDR